MKILLESNSINDTHDIADLLIGIILYNKKFIQNFTHNKALVISLEGNLGSGKTEFLKGVAQSLKLKDRISSPTFVIMKKFVLFHHSFKTLWHLDCYRVFDKKSLLEIGFKDIIKNPDNLVFIEWGNKISQLLPKKHITIKFKIAGETKRLINIFIPFKA